MKKLYFIRHGESEANKKELFAGRWDVPLTELGVQQARSAANDARVLKIDCIVSSPLLRAKQTAKIIANEIGYPQDKIIFSDLFSERDYGALQGQPWKSVENINFDEVPKIETATQLTVRAGEAVKFLRKIKADNVLLVGHGTFGRAVRAQLLNQYGAVEVPIEEELPNSHIIEWV